MTTLSSSLRLLQLGNRRMGSRHGQPPTRRRPHTTTVANKPSSSPPPLPPPQFELPKAFTIGSIAGTLGSLAGMGGGFVMIPLMTANSFLLLGSIRGPLACSTGAATGLRLTQHQAHGTSLAAVMATGLAGAASYHEHVQWESAALIAFSAMLTARIGARATAHLSGPALKRALGVLMLCMGPAVPAKAYILDQQETKQQKEEESAVSPRGNRTASSAEGATTSHFQLVPERILPPLAIGLCSGFLAGLFGVGGGTIVVPALVLTSGSSNGSSNSMTHHQALATSLAAMTLPAAVGTWTHYRAGNVAVRLAPALALGAFGGAFLGGQLAMRMEERTLQWGFSGLLSILGIRTILKA